MKRRPTVSLRRIGFGILIAGVGALIALQAVPYGRDHSNPPVRVEPRWDRARTRELAVRACFDCHSNQTRWPWYSHVAPISWLVQHDVEEGRAAVNFSEWDADEILREAEVYGADLVAVTTAGKSGLKRMVMGSVAEQVFRRARMPVLLYHPGQAPD